ncbi:hypothetical protein ASF61_12500 [Duganella sp. Leaf126]|uniref:DUF3325 family protein n=1 Tax=Duganella sp. Leaf126 TaxID=1736266 RepID=UPI0006FA8540|nr:DUF3325 family protein [Duganella sp. Leaf126]KQQ32914.1 hypothetical protein ASF61_12500 [Duganella sp. Leaf126]
MPDGLMLLLALAATVIGMGWLALSMDNHWQQVRGTAACPPATARSLRILGALALLASLVLCLMVDAASMASLVWVMSVALATVVVALTLTWRASALAPLLWWTGRA